MSLNLNCMELMVEEHKNIKRMLGIMRKYCYKILKNQEVDYEDFFKIIDFVRNYADAHHHGKEETLLFGKMTDELGTAGEKLVKHGMLVEHDLGRLHIRELEAAVKKVIDGDDEAKLDVIANAISYTHLLHRHIQKEDEVVFRFAENNLNKETLEKLNMECEKQERDARVANIQRRYVDIITELEAKA